jgi:ubiquinone/menaquinone biosynthesis C-methylase UbiE
VFRRDTNADFIRALYQGCLDREPEPEALALHLAKLRSGEMTWSSFAHAMIHSEEHRLRRQYAFVALRGLEMLHALRIRLFQQFLGPAKRVLDLGGASEHADTEGQLFLNGYPHTPEELVIIDIADKSLPMRAERGTLIRYHQGSMSDLSFIKDNSFDLVVSGQSIEHVSEADGVQVCDEVFRVLVRGGQFCVDTPNARLTKIQNPPHGLIHPEHRKEYTPDELRNLLVSAGFRITKAIGLCPMPYSAASKEFDYDEMVVGAKHFSDDLDVCFLFYFEATKPS